MESADKNANDVTNQLSQRLDKTDVIFLQVESSIAIYIFKHPIITLGNKISLFFVPRGKISNPNRAFNAEFKYVNSFSPSPTVFL